MVQNALTSEESPVGAALDRESFTWTASLGILGALIGTLFWGLVADKYGRKVTGYLTMVPFLVNWVILLAVKTERALIVARLLGGMGASGAAVNCPTYVSELSDDGMKDVLGSLFMLTYNLGVLYVFTIGTFVDYTWLNVAGLTVSALFVIAWYYAPESPVYMLRRGDVDGAKANLMWLRCEDAESKVVPELKAKMTEMCETRVSGVRRYLERTTVKALLIGLVFQTGTQLSGINVVLTYAVDIFQQSGSHLSPSTCTIVVGAVQVFASVFASCLVKRCTRKFFMITTYVLTALALFTMGWCMHAQGLQSQDDAGAGNNGLVPVLSLSLLVVAFSLGLGMVPYIVYTEIFSADVRNVCISALMFWNHALGFGVVKACGRHMHYQSFWTLSAACLLIVPYTWLCVPETKDKSFETIQRELRLWFPGDWSKRGEETKKVPPSVIENGHTRYREGAEN